LIPDRKGGEEERAPGHRKAFNDKSLLGILRHGRFQFSALISATVFSGIALAF
jgi:hypothetical protein